jgi:hypothetical protein
MIPIIVSELKLWSNKYRRMSMSVLIICVLIFGCLSRLNPEFLMIGPALALFWLGIQAGKQTWSEADLEIWFQKTHLSMIRIILGKIFATAIIVLYHVFLLLPMTYLMSALWGIDGLLVLEANLLIFVFTLLIYTLGLVFRPMVPISIIILCIWMIITFRVPAIQFMNPFYQIWMISENDANLQFWLSIAANLALLLLLIGILFLRLKREVTDNECHPSV